MVGKDGGHSSNCIVCNHQSPVEPCTPKYTPVEDTTEDGKRVEMHSVSCLVCHTPYKDSTGNDLVNSCVDNDNNGECDYCKGTVEKKHYHKYGEWTHTIPEGADSAEQGNHQHVHVCIDPDCNKGQDANGQSATEFENCNFIYISNGDHKMHSIKCETCGFILDANAKCENDPDNDGYCKFCKSEIEEDTTKGNEESGNSSTDPTQDPTQSISNGMLSTNTDIVNDGKSSETQETIVNPDLSSNPDVGNLNDANAGNGNGENSTPNQNEDQSNVNSDSNQESASNPSDLGDQSGSNSNESIEPSQEDSADSIPADENVSDSGTDTGETSGADGNGDGGIQDTAVEQVVQNDIGAEPTVDTSPT